MFRPLRVTRFRRVSGFVCVLAALVAATPSLPCVLLCLGHEMGAHDMDAAHGPHSDGLPCHGTHLTTQAAAAVQGLAASTMLPAEAPPTPVASRAPLAPLVRAFHPLRTIVRSIEPPPPRFA